METVLGLDYPTWWFLVVGAVFSGYAILDGFDLGAGALHLFFKKDVSRRIALNAVGPVWDGNEVWLVIGGGTLFAGFPLMYATLLSAFYIPFMLFLALLIFRAISIEFRSKEKMKWWRQMWDVLYSISSIGLAFALGLMIGNVLRGIPMNEHHDYTGGPFEFLNLYSILVGVMAVFLFTVHGGIYLCLKTEGKLYEKIKRLLLYAIIGFVITFVLVSFYTLLYFPHLVDQIKSHPVFFIFPLLTVLAIANTARLAHRKKFMKAFVFSAFTIASLMVLTAIELYPRLLFNTADMDNSINVYNAASSTKTLKIMMRFVLVGVPLILGYTYFVYRAFWGKVKLDETSY